MIHTNTRIVDYSDPIDPSVYSFGRRAKLWVVALVALGATHFVAAASSDAEKKDADKKVSEAGEVLNGIANLLWPVIVGGAVWLLRKQIKQVLQRAGAFSMKFPGGELVLTPAAAETPTKEREDTAVSASEHAKLKLQDASGLPLDYLFLNHTSFLRKDHQEEFRKRTEVERPHHDIQVIVDSFYEGALERIERVDYVLHEAFKRPVRTMWPGDDRQFRLKEIANGAFVIQAQVFLRGHGKPLLLHRYLTLLVDGPFLFEDERKSHLEKQRKKGEAALGGTRTSEE